MIAGLGLALGSALGTNVAFLFKQRGAVLAPPVRAHVGALALALLSVVQAVLSGRVGVSRRARRALFGFHLGRRQWAGVIVTAAGPAVIAITGGLHTSAVRHYSLAALIAVECGVFALGAALIGISMRGSPGPAARGLLLGVAAGVLFGVFDIALKVPHRCVARRVARDRQRADFGGACRFGARVLRLGSRAPAGSGRGSDRVHLGRHQPGRHHRRHSRVGDPIEIGALAIVGG